METITVGRIDGYDVLYLPEKDYLFCKNTVVTLEAMRSIITECKDRYVIPEKNLTIFISNNEIQFGCLTTTIDNCKNIYKTIKNLKDEYTKPSIP